MRNVKNLIICVLMLAMVSTATGGTLYVNTVGNGGTYTSIQAAINAAVDGDEIEVAPGTYFEAINFNGKAIRLYSADGRDATTIDATGLGSSVVTCNSGEGADTMLDGFTIKGGVTGDNGGGMYNTGSSPTVKNCIFTSNIASRGGGMYNTGSSPTVTNCTFSNNSASIHHGGGMSNYFESDPTVTNCTFSNNSSVTNGGGMYNKESNPTVTDCTFTSNTGGYGAGMHNSSSSPTVTNCTFSGNVANDSGGGMYNYINSSPTVTNCTFSDNTADVEGGGMLNNNSSPNVTNCTFTGNTAIKGGGMYNDQSSPTLTNCTFSGNTANWGGGMYCDKSSATITDCRFLGNSAENNPNADTGAVMSVNGSLQLVNCIFSGNTAVDKAGAVYCLSSDTSTIVNCAFIGNSSKFGGGVFTYSGASPTLINCTFSGNLAPNGGGAMFIFHNCHAVVKNCIFWGDTPNEIINETSTTTATYSNVQGGYPGTGNIDADPIFADADGRLSPGSPCIDAGDNSVVTVTTDLDGNHRIIGLAVDMGAYEFQEPLQHAAAKTQQLIDKIVALELPAGIENSLVSKLKNAIDSIQKAQEKAAVNKLEAFINEVEAQRGKKIPEADADALIALAQAIIDLLEAG